MKTFFYYGTMNSSKSAQLLMIDYNYRQQGHKTILIKPSLDTRTEGSIASRVGLESQADYLIGEQTDLESEKLMHKLLQEIDDANHDITFLFDESQFLPLHFLKVFFRLCDQIKDNQNIVLMFYGLQKDFQAHLFPASQFLLENVDDIREIKTICYFCNRKATFNLRTQNHKPIYTGEQIQIGDEEYYPTCYHHYYKPNLEKLQQSSK